MAGENKRISLLLREDQYETLSKKGLNISGLIRDLIDDHLSSSTITLDVSKETKEIYQTIVSNTGSVDADIEKHFKKSLHDLMQEKIEYLKTLSEKLR